jgi:hypothetical protein
MQRTEESHRADLERARNRRNKTDQKAAFAVPTDLQDMMQAQAQAPVAAATAPSMSATKVKVEPEEDMAPSSRKREREG